MCIGIHACVWDHVIHKSALRLVRTTVHAIYGVSLFIHRSRRVSEHAVQAHTKCGALHPYQVSTDIECHWICFDINSFPPTRRPFGTEPEFFVQLFVEFDETLKTPTVEILLHRMFKEQQITFAEVGPIQCSYVYIVCLHVFVLNQGKSPHLLSFTAHTI